MPWADSGCRAPTIPAPTDPASATVRADASNVEGGLNQIESMVVGRCLPRLNHRRALEFFCAATADADEMVMIAMVAGGKLEPPTGLTQFKLLKEAHFDQKSKCAINRGQRHPGLRIEQSLMHILSAEMTTRPDLLKQLKDPQTLGCQTTTVLMQASLERILYGRRRRSSNHPTQRHILNSSSLMRAQGLWDSIGSMPGVNLWCWGF